MPTLELMNAGELHYFDDKEINELTFRAQELIEKIQLCSCKWR